MNLDDKIHYLGRILGLADVTRVTRYSIVVDYVLHSSNEQSVTLGGPPYDRDGVFPVNPWPESCYDVEAVVDAALQSICSRVYDIEDTEDEQALLNVLSGMAQHGIDFEFLVYDISDFRECLAAIFPEEGVCQTLTCDGAVSLKNVSDHKYQFVVAV